MYTVSISCNGFKIGYVFIEENIMNKVTQFKEQQIVASPFANQK